MIKRILFMIKRILGVMGISVWFSLLFYGVGSFFTRTELELYWFFIPLFLLIAFLTSCLLLYSVNKTLWNSVHNAHEKKEGMLCLIPDLYLIVDFIEYVGKVW